MNASITFQSAIAITLIISLGCKNPDIVLVSPDTYLIVRFDRAGIWGSPGKLKTQTILEANKFATRMGKVAIPLTTKETPVAPGRLASIEYQFRVVDKDDPEARRTTLVPRPDLVIEKSEKISADIRTKDQSDKTKDIYTELMKLDELRGKGIITDAEFEIQKKKILSEK